MPDLNDPQGPSDYNEAAAYAAQYTQLGGRLDLGPSLTEDGQGSFELAKPETDDDVAKFYEQNPNLYIDLSQPDAEQTWHSLVKGMKNRNDSIFEALKDAGGEIAKLPFTLAEGMMESPDLRTWTASTVEGAVRGLRDMWGMVSQSENPTSLLFNFKSALRAITSGKPSQNWQEEAQQWNEARKFLYHSQKMAMGDETLLDQFDFINASDEAKERWRSFINPKIAHTMAFMGLEIPSLLAAPFTAGATSEAAIAAGINLGRQGVTAAQKANWLSKVGQTLARHQANFENMAAKFSQRMVGHTASALGNALQPIANIAEGAIGGTIKNISERSGLAEGTISNAAQGLAARGAEAVGAGEIRQTVGFLGSMGLRSTSELLKEIGDANLNLANGVVSLKDVTGLTVLERVAANEALSGSARMAAKFANITVDPLIQMSTAALKNGYKDALIFGALGYANDKTRGAAGGAATGMVWGGYSGAFRHVWSSVTGGMQHGIQIKHFDENILPIIEQQSPEFAISSRKILSDVDKLQSTRISSNTRVALQTAFAALSKTDRANMLFHIGDADSLVAAAQNKGISLDADDWKGARASFFAFKGVMGSTDSKTVPILFIDQKSYRPIDVGHEIMAHLLSYSLESKNMLGDFHRQLIGTKENGGVYGDDNVLLDSIVRRSLAELAHGRLVDTYVKDGNAKSYAEIMSTPEGQAKYRNWVENFVKKNDLYNDTMKVAKGHIKEIRSKAAEIGDVFWHGSFMHQGLGREVAWKDFPTGEAPDSAGIGRTLRYVFEENVAQYSEALFLHTNLADITKGASAPTRLAIESLRTNLFARQLNAMEMAGIQARNEGTVLDKNGNPVINAYVYDNGKYYRSPEMDGLVRRMVRTALDLDGQSVEKLSPQRMAMEARRWGKEYLFNMSGVQANMLSVKQRNELLTKRAEQGIKVLESLDPKNRPPIEVDIHGNKSVDMYRMSDEAYDALVNSGVLDKHSADTAKAWRDAMLEWERTGYVSPNTFSAEYLGDSHRTVKDGWFRRIFRPDTPVTHRLFVPYELRMSFKTTSEDGKPLRTPKGHMLATVLDVNALFRRQLNNWSRPDVQATFKDLTHFRNTFQSYLMNMMKEPSARVPSADLFRAEFGKDAEKVRNIMHETFGARKRADESYANPPREGYKGNPEDPNYPIHSMRLEYIIGAEKMPSVPVPFNIHTSYEPLRTNKSVAGFAPVNEDGTRFRNGQGFEIFSGRSRHKLFSPYGEPIGVYDSLKKAVKASNKYLGRMDESDVLPMPVEVETLPKLASDFARDMLTAKETIGSVWDGGAMKSAVGINKEGKVIRFEPEFVSNVADIIKNSYSKVWSRNGAFEKNENILSSNGAISIRDLLTQESLLKYQKFMKDVEGSMEYDALDMLIIPSPEADVTANLPANGGTGNRALLFNYDNDASHYVVSSQGRTYGSDVYVDMNFLSSIDSSKEGMSFQIQTIAKREMLRRSLLFGTLGEHYYGTPTAFSTIPAAQIRGMAAIVRHLKEMGGKGNALDQSIKIAGARIDLFRQVSDMANELQRFISTRNTDPASLAEADFGMVNRWGTPIVKGGTDVFPSRSDYTRNVNKAESDKMLSLCYDFLDKASQSFNKEIFIYPHDMNTEGFSAVFVLKGDMMTAFDKVVRHQEMMASRNPESSMHAALIGNKFLHGMFQLVSPTREGKQGVLEIARRDKIRTDSVKWSSGAGKKSILTTDLISADYSSSMLSKIGEETVGMYLVMGKDDKGNYINTGVSAQQSSGVVIAFHPTGKNSVFGGFNGQAEVGGRKHGKNLARRTALGFGPQISSFDAVARMEANGAFPKFEKAHKDGTINRLLEAMTMEQIKGSESDIVELYSKNLRPDGRSYDMESVALGIAQMAVREKKESLYNWAMAVAKLEKTTSQEFQAKFTDSVVADYAYKNALAEVAALTQEYHALPNGEKTIGDRAMTVFDTKEMLDVQRNKQSMLSGAKEWIGTVLSDSKENAKSIIHSEASKLMKAIDDKVVDGATIMKSVAAVSGLSDEIKSELRSKGWLKSIRIAGKRVQTFEFSDKDASLNLSRVQGQQHLLPWVNMANGLTPEEGFQQYVNWMETSEKAGISTYSKVPFSELMGTKIVSSTTLGEVFNHSELFKYFPELRDVEVEYANFFGAYAQFSPTSKTKYKIVLGIRSMSGYAMDEGLVLKRQADPETQARAASLLKEEAYRSSMASENPMASVLLHEVQHILQFHTGIETPAYRMHGKVGEAYRKAFSDLLGVWNVLPEIEDKDASGNFKVVSKDTINMLANSPYFSSHLGRSRHIISSLWFSTSEYVRDRIKKGELDEQVYGQRLLDLSAKSVISGAKVSAESLIEFYNELMDMHESLAKDSTDYALSMGYDTQFRVAQAAISMITDLANLNVDDPIHFKMSIQSMQHAMSNIDYMMVPHERMARETQSRAKMSQSELLSSPRKFTEDLPAPTGGGGDTALQIIDMALQKGKNESGAFNSLMLSIGGLGERSQSDSAVLEGLGRLSLMNIVVHKAWASIDSAKAVSVMAKGWYVDESGRVRLKNGRYIFRGKTFDELTKTLNEKGVGRNLPEDEAYKLNQSYIHEGSYTIEDLAKLADVVVESRMETTVGNELIDAILSPAFPATIKPENLMGELAKTYVPSSDSAFAANLDVIEKVLLGKEGLVLTKNDLANLIVFYHRTFGENFEQSGEGSNIYARGVSSVDIAGVPRERKISAMSAIGQSSSGSSAINNATSINAGSGFSVNKHDLNANRLEAKYGMGRFVFRSAKIEFIMGETPSWVKSLGEDASNEWQKRGTELGNRLIEKLNRRVFTSSGEASNIADSLNSKLSNKLLLIEPILDEAIKVFTDKERTNASYSEGVNFTMQLLDEMTRVQERVAFGTLSTDTVMRYNDKTLFDRMTVPTSGSVISNTGIERIVSKLGGVRSNMDSTGLGEVGSPNLRGRGFDPMVSMSNPEDSPAEWAARPMGMLSFMAGSVENIDAAEGISTSTSYSTFGVRGYGIPMGDSSLAHETYSGATKEVPLIGSLSERVYRVGQFSEPTRGSHVFYSRLNDMLDGMKETIDSANHFRGILRDSLKLFLENAMSNDGTTTKEGIEKGISAAYDEARSRASEHGNFKKYEPFLKDLDVAKANEILAQIDLEESSTPREVELIDVVSDIATLGHITQRNPNVSNTMVETAMPISNMSQRYHSGYSQPVFPIDGTQAINVGGVGLFNVTAFTADASAQQSYRVNGMVGGGIPYIIRSKNTNAAHATEINLYNSIFANVVNNTTDGEKIGMANNNVSRLAVFHDVATSLSDYALTVPRDMFEISSNVDAHSAYLFGGSFLSLFSVVREAAHKEGISVVDYANRFPLVQQISDGTPYSEIIPSPIAGLSSKTASGAQFHPAMLGVATALPLASTLNKGYIGWLKSGKLGLVVPEAITSPNFRMLIDAVEENREGVKGLVGNESFRNHLKQFVEQLTSEDIGRMALECSSNANAMTISNMMSFLNSWGLTKEQVPRTVGNAKISTALSAGLASGVQFRMNGHPASPAKAGLPKETVTRLQEFLKHSMKQESFWIGYFSSLHELNKDEKAQFPSPVSNSVNDGNPHAASRSNWTVDRGVGYVYAPLSKSRFSVEKGHPVNADATYPMGQGISFDTSEGDRAAITDSGLDWRYFQPKENTAENAIPAEDGGGQQGISIRGTYHPQVMFGYGDFFTRQEDSDVFNQKTYWNYMHDHLGHYENEMRMHVYDDVRGSYVPIEQQSVPSGDIGTRQVVAQAAQFSRGLRRKILTNMIINAAEQMGVKEVGVQPARFSASAKPDRMVVGMPSVDSRAGLVLEKPLAMHMNAMVGRPISSYQSRGSGFQGEVTQNGFSWQRLPDGRVMVNFCPHVGINTTWDMALDSKFNKVAPLGINLRRAIGWDSTKEGLLIPQAFVRQHGLLENNSNVRGYLSSNAAGSRASAVQLLQNRLESLVAFDPAYLEHAHIASARVAKNLDFGQNLTNFISSVDASVSTPKQEVRAYIEGLLGGERYSHDMTNEGMVRNMHNMSSILSMNSPENSYYTFILPKDFNEAHLHEGIAGIALAHHHDLLQLASSEGREIYRSGRQRELMHLQEDAYNPFAYKSKSESIENSYSRIMKANEGGPQSASRQSFILPYESSKSETTGNTDVASRVLSESTARFFSNNQVRNPNFLNNIQSLHQRISSQERGYFLPENERSVTTNGDRLAIIDAMFPNRPDLRQFAWDDSSKINLTVFKKSDKSGYVVGYDMVTGMDAAGLPVRRRITRTFRTEGEANSHASEVASKSVLAEIPSIMAREGTVRLRQLDADPFAEANPFQKMTLNADPSQGAFSMSENSFGVGNFNVSFPTLKEAKAFAEIAMTPEALAGEPKARETIMMSTKGTSELEQDVRSTINFGTLGSPYQFGSNLMKAINSGLVRDRSGKKEFKDAYIGKDWYDLLVTNGTSKMELRTSGVVEFLYANKDNMLSRQDLAEFAQSMYPRMGRQIIVGSRIQSSVIGNMTIPSSLSPIQLHNNSMGPYAGHLSRVMDMTKFNTNGTHPEVFKAIQNAVVDAFKNAYATIHGMEKAEAEFKTIEDVWSAFDKQRLGTRPSVNGLPDISPQMAEVMRIGFNDFIAKAKIEHAAELAGLPLEMPDVLTGYDGPESRPSYASLPTLAHAPEALFSEGTKGMVTQLTNASHWSEYTSGLGPYQVDILSGHFYTEEMKTKGRAYIAAIDKRINEAPLSILDVNVANKEIERLKNMRDAVKRVMAVRERLTNVGNITSGHWRTPGGSIQYGHARYSFGSASKLSLPLEGLHSLYGNFSTPSVMMPLLFVEEVQSDIYQKNTFGPPSRGELRLSTDFKQAEQGALFGELDQIKKRMAELSCDKQTTIQPIHRAITSCNQRLITMPIHKVSFMNQIQSMGAVERHAFLTALISVGSDSRIGTLNMTDDGKVMFKRSDYYGNENTAPIDTGIRVDKSKTRKISNALADKLAIGTDVPDVQIGPQGASHLADMLIAYHHRNDMANIGMPIGSEGRYLAYEAALGAMGFSITDKVPSTGNVLEFRNDLTIRPNGEDTQAQITMRAVALASMVDEGFQSSIREIAKAAQLENRTGHSFDYDALASRIMEKFRSKANDPNTSPAARKSLGIMIRDLEAAMSLPASEVIMPVFERTSKNPEGYLSDNPFSDIEPSDIYQDKVSLKQMLNKSYVYATPVTEANPLGISLDSTETVRFKYVEMTPARAYRVYAEQVKKMPFSRSVSEGSKREALVRAAEAIAKAYEDETNGKSVGHQEWDKVHSDFKQHWYSDHLWNGVNRPITCVGSDMGRIGNGPYTLTNNMVAEPSKSKTAAGKHLEHLLSPAAVSLERFMPSDELEKLTARKGELEKVLQIDPSKSDGDNFLPDSIPLGEDGTYRSLMMQFYTMRALQSQRNGIAFADARHHRSRYGSNGYVYGTMMLGPNLPYAMPKGNSVSIAARYIMNEAAKHSPDGVLMTMATKGIHSMSPDFSNSSGSGGMVITHNGVTDTFVNLAMAEVTKFVKEQMMPVGTDHTTIINQTRTTLERVFSNEIYVDGGYLSLKDYIQKYPSGLNAEQVGKYFHMVFGSDEGLNMHKRIAKILPAPTSPFINKPYGRTNGYTANYGTPKWNTSVYYSGMPTDFINGLSNDAFERPLVQLGQDGTYTLSDPKTNKPIMSGVTQEQLQERVAQNSKYLGKSPMITPFLKVFGKAGAYVMDGALFSNRNLENVVSGDILNALKGETSDKVTAIKGEIGMRAGQVVSKKLSADVFGSLQESGNRYSGESGNRSSAIVPMGHPEGEGVPENIFINASLHAVGLRPEASSDEIAAAVAKVGSFSSPVLVIKPKFPTATHIAEIQKILAEGVPLMSTKGVGGEEGAINAAIQGFRFYATPTQRRRDEQP